ncbi:MAG: hypothetical protein QM655_15950 [Nocardioidaceae bacterium]
MTGSGLPVVTATRYVAPLREGGSLPGLVEADDLGIYVCKFHGAGQGPRVLVAEVIVGELARRLGIATPDLAVVDLSEPIARYEADEEVQDLLNASIGLNLGVDFLPGSFGFDSSCDPDPRVAARILWLDAFTANVDRSWRNPNLLMWGGELWAIDHGAALYFHHGWTQAVGDPGRFAAQPYDISDHCFAAHADRVPEVDAELRSLVSADVLDEVLALVPDVWLVGPAGPADLRAAYRSFLLARIGGDRPWLPGRFPQ